MPEEHNRVETDGLSDVLCAPCPGARDVLVRERVPGAVHVTGDPLCDALELARRNVEPDPGDYLLATVHCSCNTDDPLRLQAVLDCLGRSPWPVVMPIDPETRAALASWGIVPPRSIRVIEPVAHPRLLALERGARVIATDSGGVQREAYLWGVPCVTLREETEWTDTVLNGWNTVVGVDPERFAAALRRRRPLSRPAIFGDGRAAQRIAELTAALATAPRTALA
jgi:UDP-N-acetylglucosamine 2-epimerase